MRTHNGLCVDHTTITAHQPTSCSLASAMEKLSASGAAVRRTVLA